MKNISLKDKIFWKNFFQFILIFCFFVFIFSSRLDEYERVYFNLLEGYIICSIVSVLYLGYKIAIDFTK